MPARVTVVIPNWNGERFLDLCLGSLRYQTFRDFETVVVDNGSTDGSIDFVREHFPDVRVVELGENRGFAAAVNAGVEASDTEFVVLLNNDTEQDQRWLGALVRAADAHPDAGLFASKLVDFHDRRVLDGAGDALRLSGLPYRLGHGERDRGQFDEPGYVFGACAAAALYREVALRGCRALRRGLRLLLRGRRPQLPRPTRRPPLLLRPWRRRLPHGKRLHRRQAQPDGDPTRHAKLPRPARERPAPLVGAAHTAVLRPRALTRFVTAAATGSLRAHLEGLAGAWRHLPLMREKRAGIQKRKQLSDAEVRKLLRESSLAAAASIARRLWDRAVSR